MSAADLGAELLRRFPDNSYVHHRLIADLRDGILAAIRAGVAEGTERAMRPAPHPLIGRRVVVHHRGEGVVESVTGGAAAHIPCAVVRRDDGTAYTGNTCELVLLPQPTETP